VAGTLDSARAAADPRELFRSKNSAGSAQAPPSGGVPPAVTRSSGALSAGMAGAATSPAAPDAVPSATPEAADTTGPTTASSAVAGREDAAELPGAAAPFDTEAT